MISSFGKDRLRTTYLHARKTGLKVLDPAGGARWEKLERSPRVWIILACVDHIDDFFVTVHLDVMPFTKQSWQNESARMYSISLWFLALKHWDQEARVGRTFTVSLRLNEDEWSDLQSVILILFISATLVNARDSKNKRASAIRFPYWTKMFDAFTCTPSIC